MEDKKCRCCCCCKRKVEWEHDGKVHRGEVEMYFKRPFCVKALIVCEEGYYHKVLVRRLRMVGCAKGECCK